jgi:hypothetical protein
MISSQQPNARPSDANFRKWLLAPFTWTLALIFLIEEALWDWTESWMARFGSLRLIHAIEQRIERLHPYAAFCAFLLPSLTIIPAKLLGLRALAEGHWIIGSAIFLTAKIAGLALFSRIFNLTRPTLMQLAWFTRFYNFVMRFRNLFHALLDQWKAYQHLKQRIRKLINALRHKPS